MELTEQIKASETRQFKMVFPCTLNANDSLFGGMAMQWMDEVAYITAIRFTRKQMVTVSADKIKFFMPIKPDSIIEVVGKIVKIGNVKIEILVEIFSEMMFNELREKAIEATFVFAAVDEENKPISLNSKVNNSIQ